MNVKKTGVIIGVVVLILFGVCTGAYQCGAAHTRDNLRAEGRTTEISRAHTELGDEQRTNIERLERIVDFTKKAGGDVRELRKSNRRSGDLLTLLEQEVDILENYLVDMQCELADYRRDGVGDNTAMEIGE